MNERLITIEGNIGAGKTTLAKMLAEDYDAKLILEEFSDNPFLPKFYEDPSRYGFPVELFFMAERYNQLKSEVNEQELFYQFTITDYLFIKSLLFASINLTEEEHALYKRLFNIINPTLHHPGLIIYLHASPDQLINNITKRGRSYESSIDANYLQKIQDRYFQFFKSMQDKLRILVVDSAQLDFVNNASDYQWIKQLIRQSHNTGIHYVSQQQI